MTTGDVVARAELAEQCWELAVTGLSTRKIAKALSGRGVDVSYKHVATLLNEKLDEIGPLTEKRVNQYRERQLSTLDTMIVEATRIARGAACPTCRGDKIVQRIGRRDLDEPVVCPRCEGTGQAWNESVRLQALRTLTDLLERQAKLSGADAPDRVSIGVGVFRFDQQSEDELNEQLDGMLGGPSVAAIELPDASVRELPAGEPASSEPIYAPESEAERAAGLSLDDFAERAPVPAPEPVEGARGVRLVSNGAFG